MNVGFKSSSMQVEGYWAPAKSAEQVVSEITYLYDGALPSRPLGAMPSLANVPDEMDTRSATMLNVVVCRWLEYVQPVLAKEDGHVALKVCELEMFTRILKHKYGGKIEKCSIEELDELNRREWACEQAKANLMVVRAMLSSLEKVRAAASRTISANTKTNVGLGD